MGGNKCCVRSCKNKANSSSCKFYTFPMSKWKMDQRNKWIAAVNRKNDDGSPWQPRCHHLICSDHFVGGQKSDEQTDPSYVPTIFPPSDVGVILLTHKERRMILLSQKYPHMYDEQVRDVVYNVYKYFKNESEEFRGVKGDYFSDVIKRVADATGVSTTYVSNLINEYAAAGPEAVVKPSSKPPQREYKRQKNESCDNTDNADNVKTPKKKPKKKRTNSKWCRPKRHGLNLKQYIVNRHKYNMNNFDQVDDSNMPFKIVDHSLYETHSPHNTGGYCGAPVSIKNEPSSEIDIVEHSLPDLYKDIEEPTSTNGKTNRTMVYLKQEYSPPLNNADPLTPVALFSNHVTMKNEPKDSPDTDRNENVDWKSEYRFFYH